MPRRPGNERQWQRRAELPAQRAHRSQVGVQDGEREKPDADQQRERRQQRGPATTAHAA
jgi:hypothetical protein